MNSRISILAGNPRVNRLEDGSIQIEPQMVAFEEALKIAKSCREKASKIVVLFDHAGIFKKQFVDPSVSRRKRDHLKLADLVPEIREVYKVKAAEYGVKLQDISVLTEDLCRLDILGRELSLEAQHRFMSPSMTCKRRSCVLDEDVNDDEKPDLKVNCTGIAAATISYLAKLMDANDQITTCWEFDPVRAKPGVLSAGIEFAKEFLGVKSQVELKMFLALPGRPLWTKSATF